ncbi:MAG: HDOD domain-containing protein [Pseudomonadota bacterium]
MRIENKSKEFEFIEGLTAELSSKKLIFPTSLNATMRIRRALNEPDAAVGQIVRIVGAEPVLSAQLLRISNSAALGNGGGKPIADLRTAISRLGFAMVRNVTISVGMQQMTQSNSSAVLPPIVEGLWKRSLRIASLSYVIAKKLTRLNPDTAMLVGLLHDVGKFYILNRARDYAGLFADEVALWDVVDQWHSNIGEAILESWEIPEEISVAVRDRLDFARVRTGAPDLTDIVGAADFMDAHFFASVNATLDEAAMPQGLIRLKLTPESSKELMRAAQEELGLIFQAIR